MEPIFFLFYFCLLFNVLKNLTLFYLGLYKQQIKLEGTKKTVAVFCVLVTVSLYPLNALWQLNISDAAVTFFLLY